VNSIDADEATRFSDSLKIMSSGRRGRRLGRTCVAVRVRNNRICPKDDAFFRQILGPSSRRTFARAQSALQDEGERCASRSRTP
jgi:hypothetical protein